jgi:hypothetical protein
MRGAGPWGALLYPAMVLDVYRRGHPLQFGPLWAIGHRETGISRQWISAYA